MYNCRVGYPRGSVGPIAEMVKYVDIVLSGNPEPNIMITVIRLLFYYYYIFYDILRRKADDVRQLTTVKKHGNFSTDITLSISHHCGFVLFTYLRSHCPL